MRVDTVKGPWESRIVVLAGISDVRRCMRDGSQIKKSDLGLMAMMLTEYE
jgi:hypothetical protein